MVPLLELEESPHFVSLYGPSRQGRLEQAAKAPLYPFVFAWLVVMERWRGWTSERLRLRSLTARRSGLDASLLLGRLIPYHRFTIRTEAIERLTFDLAPEGPRELTFTLRLRYRRPDGHVLLGAASFAVVDVDTHREAMALLFAMARMIGCSGYRAISEADASSSVELLLGTEERGARGYRDPGRPTDVRPIPERDAVTDFRPRTHGRFVEPRGLDLPEPRPDRVGIASFSPGELVEAGTRPRPWLLALTPLLLIGWAVLFLIGAVVLSMVVGLIGAVVSIAASLVGIDTWWLLLSEVTTVVIFGVAALGALVYVGAPAIALLDAALGSRVTIDWKRDRVECHGPGSRLSLPLSHVRGVDVRHSLGTRRLLLRTSEGDLSLASGGDDLIPVAVALARALDVPVTHPDPVR